MNRRKRPFYIIAHNPNSIKEAAKYLDKGANALEPDVVYAEGQFYVTHHSQPSYRNIPTVQQYLEQLKKLVDEKKYNLALLIWDLKDVNFDINELIGIVKDHFRGGSCDGVPMLFTHADNHDFISRYDGRFPDVAVGVDESDVPPAELQAIFRSAGHRRFSYADGITTFLSKPGVFQNIVAAQRCRDHHEPDSFSLIYTWVLSKKASMRKYLDTYIDGIFVDPNAVRRLRELVTSTPYNEVYELAQNGYNPFAAAPLPKYFLTIKTGDSLLAGTDARFQFTLEGSSGRKLESLPFDAALDGRLDKGSMTYLTLEGAEIGDVKNLTIRPLSGGLTAGWLIEQVEVQSNLSEKKWQFPFSTEGNELWITKKTGAVTREAGS